MSDSPKSREQTVLVLDEEPFIRDTLKLKLSGQGLRTETAGTEDEALKLLAGNPPDAIIIDILHSHIQAYSFIQSLKSHNVYKNIPVFILTFKAKDPEMEFTYNVWAEQYFTKPFSPREVASRVAEAVHSHG